MTHSPSKAAQLNILIVGAGVAGLTAAVGLARHGHTVHVLERAPDISQHGGGLVFSPNVIRVFDSWGLTEAFAPVVDPVWRRVLRRHDDEQVLRRINREENKGHAFSWYIRRQDAQKVLFDVATQVGVQVLFSARIVSMNHSQPSVTLDSGSTLHADIIIGADGHASRTRDVILESPTPEKRTGVVFQVEVPYPLPTNLPIEQPSRSSPDKAITFWIGPGLYAVAWPTRGTFDVQIGDEDYPHPSIPNVADLTDMEYLRLRIADFSPTLSELLTTSDYAYRWQIAFLPPLKSWRSPSGRVVLIGDAAHAMGPYAGQGAGMGIEDAAVLSELLRPSPESGVENIPKMVELYQVLRKPRAEKTQNIAWKFRAHFILEDGPAQERRDELFKILEARGGLEGQTKDEAWMDGYDAVGEAREALRRMRGEGQRGVEAKL